MNVSDQIIQVIDALCEKFGIAVDWTSENIIPYVQTLGGKLISYELITSIYLIVLMVIITVVYTIVFKKTYKYFCKKVDEERYDECGWSVARAFFVAGLLCITLATIIVIAIQTNDIIKCLTFPELFIFEYISNLLQSGC